MPKVTNSNGIVTVELSPSDVSEFILSESRAGRLDLFSKMLRNIAYKLLCVHVKHLVGEGFDWVNVRELGGSFIIDFGNGEPPYGNVTIPPDGD